MAVAPSFDDIVEVGRAEIQAVRATLAFRDGDYSKAFVHGAGAMADMDIRYHAQGLKETFLDGAEDEVLTALVNDRYNIQRNEATFAQVSLTFERTSGGASGSIPAGTRVRTDFDTQGNAISFETDAVVNVPLADNGPFTVLATAVIAGPSGNVEVEEIEFIQDTLFDTTFSVTNEEQAAGGNSRESDPDLRTRARDFYRTLRRGTLAALEYGAKLVASVRNARATEDEDTGIVTVTVSDEDGNSTLEMISDVETEEENWRAGGSTLVVVGGTQKLVSIDYELECREGFNVAARADDFTAAVVNRMKRLRAGESFNLDMGTAALIAVAPDDVLKVTELAITVNGSPADVDDDVTATSTQVIRADVITVTAA